MTQKPKRIPASFFKDCVFVSIDFQEEKRPKPFSSNRELDRDWQENGFGYQDVNAANDFLWETARPNARKVANACRKLGLPMVFVHWGHTLDDGMDLEPGVRQRYLRLWGKNYAKWPNHISRPGSKPASFFKVRKNEYVIAKTAMDAFPSSNLPYVLQNLAVKNILFVGGHAGACLGQTSKSAKKAGYRTLCVEDATFDARESRRTPNMQACGYDYVVSTKELLSRMDAY